MKDVCSTQRGCEKCFRLAARKPERKRQFKDLRVDGRITVESILNTGSKIVYCIEVMDDRTQGQAFGNRLMNVNISKKSPAPYS
jgi:hypothetical protein